MGARLNTVIFLVVIILSLNSGLADLYMQSRTGGIYLNTSGIGRMKVTSGGNLVLLGLSNFTVSGNLTAGSGAFHVDSVNGMVGVGVLNATSYLDIRGSTSGASSVRIQPGTQPSSPKVGDMYSSGQNLFYYDGISWQDITSSTTSGGWTDDGVVVRLASSSDFVGIGTDNPSEKLYVEGNGTYTGDLVVGGDVISGGSYGSGLNGDFGWVKNEDVVSLSVSSNWVGIGVNSPNSSLTVKGNITPSKNNSYTLGEPDLVWEEVYVGPNSLHVGGLTLSNDAGTLKWDGSSVDTSRTDEEIMDLAGVMATSGTGVNLVHSDAGNTITATFDAADVDGTCLSGSGTTLSVTGDCIGDTQLAYNTGQHLTTSSAPTFATVNTGYGAYEVNSIAGYYGNQNLRTTDNPTFNRVYLSDYGYALGGIHVGGSSDPGTDNLVVDGIVQIGSTYNGHVFSVYGSDSSAYIARFFNDGNNADRYGVLIQSGTDSDSGTNYKIGFRDGDGTNVGSITSSGGTVSYNPFTGAHIGIISSNELSYGFLLCIDSVIKLDERKRQVLYNVSGCYKNYSKAVIGVYAGEYFEENYVNFSLGLINSLGDGHILVSSDGGDIEVGDYLVSSEKKGHAIRQNDDLLHSYTAAKATESVNWQEEENDTKLISCTYHAG